MVARSAVRAVVSASRPFALASAAACFFVSAPSALAAPSKDECVDSHGLGQDARDKGQLSQARQYFMTCAQSSCPNLIQADCARFGEELERLLPTVSFAARDAKQVDLPDTSVYIDNVPAASRLDEGKLREVDPGKHTIRFVHNGQEVIVTVVINPGEKGRLIMGTFPDKNGSTSRNNGSASSSMDASSDATPSRSAAPLVVAGVGGAALIAGGALALVGLSKVPSTCSYSSKECIAPPGDTAFTNAKSGASLVNTGMIVGGAGAATLVGGLVWYLATPPKVSKVGVLSPWATPQASGVAFAGAF